MLLNNALYADATVYVISRDTVFARMIELELAEAGLNAIRSEEMPTDAAETDKLRVFTVSSDVLEENDGLRADVEFGYSHMGSGRAERYFKRPFAIEELVKAVVERVEEYGRAKTVSAVADGGTVTAEGTAQEETATEITSSTSTGLALNAESGEFTYNGEALSFTETERALLTVLYENRGTAVSREELLERVWGRNEGAKTNLTDVYIRYLREKLDDRFDLRLILSVRGKGYMLR